MSQDDALPETTPAHPEELIPSPEDITEEAAPSAEQLAEAVRRAEENWDQFVRTRAELENLKRRAEKDVQNAHKFGLEKFARELLTVADSLELGLSVETTDSPEVQKLREGMALTLKQLVATLEKFNVRGVDPMGDKFNPEWHQAMSMQPTDTAEPNTVIKVFQKGYLLNDRLLRPAMVVFAQAIE